MLHGFGSAAFNVNLMVERFCYVFFVVLGYTDQKTEAFFGRLEGNIIDSKVCVALGSTLVSWSYCWR